VRERKSARRGFMWEMKRALRSGLHRGDAIDPGMAQYEEELADLLLAGTHSLVLAK
jgi:hypothetical protein